MNKTTTHKPTASKFSLLRQLCNFIPPHLVSKLARDTGVENQWRDFTPWSHVVSLLYAQIPQSRDQRRVRRPAAALRPAVGAARCHAAAQEHPLLRQPQPRSQNGRAAFLGHAGSFANDPARLRPVSYTHLRAHETGRN